MKAEKKLTILNKYGLHVRPSMRLAETAKRFSSNVALDTSDGRVVDAKGMLAVLGLGLRAGAEITLRAEGDDAEETISTLTDLAHDQFGMEYDV